ncbi:MAG: outer membrane protein transport protein [Muribaculum sp.]|nr:outer membrane protein transport protein [Muribaculaceae bacterium]MCM1081401.1 outer membrane protein transport protein [Muribaculum sp.]
MKKTIIAATVCIAFPSLAFAQAAVDLATMSQLDLTGTARFMSMGGAFTALGGDLSTLGTNPAGIGVYRSSEIGITLNLMSRNTETTTRDANDKHNKTLFRVNNFGYVGSFNLYNNTTPYVNFGVSYSRVASFDRIMSGGWASMNGSSLSNYIAAMTNSEGDIPFQDMKYNGSYNPYLDGMVPNRPGASIPWLSILAYNGYVINDNADGVTYSGLMGEGTTGSGEFKTREKGYVDEYNITFGGNVMNMFYYGIGVGITDLDYKQYSYYQENLNDAYIAASRVGAAENDPYSIVNGKADYRLNNFLHSSGSGFNLKLGVIVRPINELRIGLSVQTPTWYNMTDTYWGGIDYKYTPNDPAYNTNPAQPGEIMPITNGGSSWHNYHMRTPWRMTVGLAGVIGSQVIVSADYEYRGNNMQVSDVDDNEYADVTHDVKTYYKGTHTLRLGAEFRVTPQFSLRAGYAYQTSPVKSVAENDGVMIWTAGTIPSYTLNKSTQYVTVGAGYRFNQHFYADFAYVNRQRKSTFHAYSPVIVGQALDQASPSAAVSARDNEFVLTVGYKF